MVVGCPKCKAKLKIPDEKIKPEGTKFRCPKCQAMLLVKRPAAKAAPPPPPPKFEAPPKMPAPETEAPSPAERELWPETSGASEGMEPWPDMPHEPEAPPPPPFEEAPAPEPSPFPPFEEEPEAPPPPFEEAPAPEPPPPPPPFEEETEAPPPPFEEEPSPGAPPAMEPVMEAPAPPVAPPEEEMEKEVPSAEAPTVEAPPEGKKVLIAFPDPQMVNMLKFVLLGANFVVSSATDGVTAIVRAIEELPSVVVADVRLSKINGIELLKRLRGRAETKDAKIILTGSKPENQMPVIEGISGYIHQDRMQQGLVDLIKKALAEPSAAPAPAGEPAAAQPGAAAPRPSAPPADAGVQRAQRFARTVLADIELYNKEKVDQSIRDGNFENVFAKELKEGRKLYEMRVPADARGKGKFYEDAVRTFLEKKKKQLGI